MSDQHVREPGSLSIDELKSLYTESQLQLHSANLRMEEMGKLIVELHDRLRAAGLDPEPESHDHDDHNHLEVVAHDHEHELVETH